MSWYTAGEILLWLILAAVLGFILGWLIRGFLGTRRTRDRELALEREVQEARDAKLGLERDLQLCRDARAGLERDLQKSRDVRVDLERDLQSCREARLKLEQGVDVQVAPAAFAVTGDDDIDITMDTTPSRISAWAREKVAAIAARTAGDGENPEDDLREVHGIGEVISKMLYSMDITSFRQVARFTKEDIATVSDALEVFPDRIERDDWMSSARELHKEKYGYDA